MVDISVKDESETSMAKREYFSIYNVGDVRPKLSVFLICQHQSLRGIVRSGNSLSNLSSYALHCHDFIT